MILYVAAKLYSKKVNQTNKSKYLLITLKPQIAIVDIFSPVSNTGKYYLH